MLHNYEFISLYFDNGMKVLAIDHNVYLSLFYDMPHLIYNHEFNGELERYRHKFYPKAHAVVALSAFDALIWDRVGVRSRFIPNPSTYEMYPI
jgi:hypothetical protein